MEVTFTSQNWPLSFKIPVLTTEYCTSFSPSKIQACFVYRTVPVVKCMADKSTKTDDILLNGEVVGVSGTVSCKPGESVTSKQQQQQKQGSANAVPSCSKPVPTTTNAATMTSAVVVTDVAPAPTRTVVATTTSTGTATSASLTTPTSVPAQTDVCSPTVS